MVSVTLGTALEYVDFALYGLATALVFQPLFFPESSPVMALIKGFAIYGIGSWLVPSEPSSSAGWATASAASRS